MPGRFLSSPRISGALSTCLGSRANCGFPEPTAASSWEPSGTHLPHPLASPLRLSPRVLHSRGLGTNGRILIPIPASSLGLNSQCSLLPTGNSVRSCGRERMNGHALTSLTHLTSQNLAKSLVLEARTWVPDPAPEGT